MEYEVEVTVPYFRRPVLLACYPLGFHLFINHNQKLPAYERKILACDP